MSRSVGIAVLAVFVGCCGRGVVLTEGEMESLGKAQGVKSETLQIVKAVKTNPKVAKPVLDDLEKHYRAVKAPHDALIDLLTLQVELGQPQSEAIKKKAGEVEKGADELEKFIQKQKVEAKGIPAAIIAGILIDAGIKIWEAYSRIERERLNELKTRVKAELNKMRFPDWAEIK